MISINPVHQPLLTQGKPSCILPQHASIPVRESHNQQQVDLAWTKRSNCASDLSQIWITTSRDRGHLLGCAISAVHLLHHCTIPEDNLLSVSLTMDGPNCLCLEGIERQLMIDKDGHHSIIGTDQNMSLNQLQIDFFQKLLLWLYCYYKGVPEDQIFIHIFEAVHLCKISTVVLKKSIQVVSVLCN